MEKILNIYTHALFVPDLRRSSLAGHPTHTQQTPHTTAAPEMSLTWNQFAQLCVVSALWFLQQAAAAHELLGQCTSTSLTLEELAALRFGFSQYDSELSGVISVSDLRSLLQVL